MRVWLIQRAESTPHDDGGTRRLMRIGMLASLMAARGHDVVWWTSAFDHVSKSHRHDDSCRLMTSAGYEVHYVQTRGYTRNVSMARFMDNRSLNRNFKRDMAKEVDIPDVIFAAIPSVEMARSAVQFGLENDVPVILDIRDLYPDVLRELVPKRVRPLVDLLSVPMRRRLRQASNGATSISGITEEFVDWGVGHAGRERSPQDRVFGMAYGEPAVLEEAVKGREFWRGRLLASRPDALHVLFLGTFTNSFDFATPLAAARLLANSGTPVCFTFCGTGAKEAELEVETADLPNVDVVGWVNSPQIQWALRCSDIGLAPYIATANFAKNVPNKPAEYMSGGLAVASSLTEGPLWDLLRSSGAGFGYGCNPQSFADQLADLCADRVRLGQMQQAAQRVFREQYSSAEVYGRLSDYLETHGLSAESRAANPGETQ